MRPALRPRPDMPPDGVTGALIRVLLIDDSVVVRAILARTLATCADIAVVGQAASAAQALRLLDEVGADVILLDLEMPGVDGLAALPTLLAHGRGARVMVVSSACGAGAEATVRALRLGAADTLPKPDGLAFAADFAAALIDGIRRLAPPMPARSVSAEPSLPSGPMPRRAAPQPIEVVGIAASTGGVHALGQFLGALPKDFTAPILVTQHLPLPFTPVFAAQIGEASGRPVRIAATGMQPVAGEILLAPGDAHLTLARTGTLVHVRLEGKRSASGCLPSADPMLASLARIHGPGAVAVVLSGMGRDGADGAAALVAAGGTVLAQDQDSSVVWGMPGTVTRRGLTSAVLPPVGLAGWLAGAQAERGNRWN